MKATPNTLGELCEAILPILQETPESGEMLKRDFEWVRAIVLSAYSALQKRQATLDKSTDEIKYIDIAEFRKLGYVQEVNRKILHPCGLAMEIMVERDGTEHLGGVWDYRDDPEGMTFGPGVLDPAKEAAVSRERDKHADARRALFDGSVIQPVPEPSDAG